MVDIRSKRSDLCRKVYYRMTIILNNNTNIIITPEMHHHCPQGGYDDGSKSKKLSIRKFSPFLYKLYLLLHADAGRSRSISFNNKSPCSDSVHPCILYEVKYQIVTTLRMIFETSYNISLVCRAVAAISSEWWGDGGLAAEPPARSRAEPLVRGSGGVAPLKLKRN